MDYYGILTFYNLAVIEPTTRFNFQKFSIVLTLLSDVRYGLLPYAISTDWLFITEVDSVYCAVRTESLYTTDTFLL